MRLAGYPQDQHLPRCCTWLNLAPAGWLRPGAFFRVCDAEKPQNAPRALKSCISKIRVIRLSLLNQPMKFKMNIENFAKMRALQNAHTSANTQFLDHVLSGAQGDEIREKILTKRLQFDTTPVLYSMVENLCGLLDCSKREFLEMAVVEACNKAEAVFGDTYVEATGHGFGEPEEA